MGRNGGDGQGQAYGVLKRIKGIRIGTEKKVIEMKQGSLKMRMG